MQQLRREAELKRAAAAEQSARPGRDMRNLIAAQLAVLLIAACVPVSTSSIPPRVVEPIIVFFGVKSASLSDEARAAIKAAIERANKFDCGKLLVVGHTDGGGIERRDVQLSVRRAEIVRDQLLQDGYKGSIAVEGRGSRDALKPNASGNEEQLNRRVQIDFGCRIS